MSIGVKQKKIMSKDDYVIVIPWVVRLYVEIIHKL